MKKILKKLGGWIKRHKVVSILIVIVLIAAIVGTILFVNLSSKSTDTMAITQNTVSLSKMDLTSSVSATGTIASADTKTVSAALQDVEIKSVKVKEGDTVTKGQTLVTFDKTDLQSSLDEATDNLTDAKTQASQELSSAQKKVTEAQTTYSEQKTKLAKSVASAKSEYTSAQKTVTSLKKQVAKASGATKTKLQEQLTQAQSALKQAKSSYEQAVSEQSSSNKQNKSSIETAKDSVSTTKINSKKTIREAQKSYDDAKESLEKCSVTAPMSGTVTAVGVEAGDTYSGGDMFEISNLDSLMVTTSVDEYDITGLKKGQKVVILTDATDEDEIAGVITFISPTTGSSSLSTSSSSSSSQSAGAGSTGGTSSSSSSSSSSSGYTVEIKINKTDSRLRVGMTAKCSIVLDEKQDVFAVPYDAIHTNSSNQSVIYVVDTTGTVSGGAMSGGRPDAVSGGAMGAGGQPPQMSDDSTNKSSSDDSGKPNFSKRSNASNTQVSQKEIVVTKGMESDYYVEITGDGLTEGLKVIIPTDTTSSSSSSSSSKSNSSSSSLGILGGSSGSSRGGGGAPGGGGMPGGM